MQSTADLSRLSAIDGPTNHSKKARVTHVAPHHIPLLVLHLVLPVLLVLVFSLVNHIQ